MFGPKSFGTIILIFEIKPFIISKASYEEIYLASTYFFSNIFTSGKRIESQSFSQSSDLFFFQNFTPNSVAEKKISLLIVNI